jgi:hypothetical protein
MNKELFIKELLSAWEKVPNQRFGQFIYNSFRNQNGLKDFFYTGDSEFLDALKEFTAKT